MFINETLTSIFFKFLNFFAVIGLAFLVFKKYIKSDLLAHIQQKEIEKENLQTQQLTLEKQQQELDALIKEETIQCQDFRSKIDTWKKGVSLEQDVLEKKHHDILLAVKQRKTEITLRQENRRVRTIVTNAVVQDLEKSLSRNFKDPKKSFDYLDAIVHFMKESVS